MIRMQLFEKNMTVTELAKRIYRSREATRDILNKKSINTDLLLDISKVLDYDFFKEYSKVQQNGVFYTAKYLIMFCLINFFALSKFL